MAAEGERLTLYVRSELARPGLPWGSLETTGIRLSSMVVPALVLRPTPMLGARLPPELVQLRLPHDQAQCVRLVTDMVAQRQEIIQIVDVTTSGAPASDIERAIGSGGSYPVLVRPDGAWLEGPEYFTPSRLKKFLK